MAANANGVRGAHPERHLEAHVARTLAPTPGETLLVAASGGPDSTALAALAVRAAQRRGASVVLGHVNHGVREAAWQDEAVALAIGASLGARVLCAALDPENGSEATLRERRYAALVELAIKAGAATVCTAHHAEDQTETVLLALFRGAGRRGLAGMESRRPLAPRIALVRPLLRVGREALVRYCSQSRLPFAIDRSNADSAFRRNAIRVALHPLREAFPRLDEAVARSAEIARGEEERTAPALFRKRLRRALAQGGADLRDVSFERLEAAARLALSGGEGRVFIKDGVEVRVRRG